MDKGRKREENEQSLRVTGGGRRGKSEGTKEVQKNMHPDVKAEINTPDPGRCGKD